MTGKILPLSGEEENKEITRRAFLAEPALSGVEGAGCARNDGKTLTSLLSPTFVFQLHGLWAFSRQPGEGRDEGRTEKGSGIFLWMTLTHTLSQTTMGEGSDLDELPDRTLTHSLSQTMGEGLDLFDELSTRSGDVVARVQIGVLRLAARSG